MSETATGGGLQVFLLVLFRVAGLLMVAPLFGGETVPRKARLMLALVLALLIFPLTPPSNILLAPNLGIYFLAALQETAVGLVLGFAATLLFTAVQFAGQLIGQEIGLTLANVIDPISNAQVSVIGQFKMFLCMIVWLLLDGHHFLIGSLFVSFDSIPLMSFSVESGALIYISDTMMGDMFLSAFRLAAPAVVTLFLVTLSMAFLARVVPEMNIFILGFTIRIVVGLIVLWLGISIFVDIFGGTALEHNESLENLMEQMKPGG